VECSNCSSSTAASRYAQHLEKCLGRGGRTSSRAASARLKASAEKAEKEAALDDAAPRRQRHHAGGPPAAAAHHHGPPASKVEDTIFATDLPPLPDKYKPG
jgi:Sgf11 (transcriptional regulation protein)